MPILIKDQGECEPHVAFCSKHDMRLRFARAHLGGREGRCESMKLNVRQIGHVAVVDLTGKITVGEGDAVLREGVFELLQSDQKQILLNLRKVPYIDSSGIGEMVACYKAARDKNGTVKLLNPSEKVSDLLQITRLEEVFETYRDEKEALRSF